MSIALALDLFFSYNFPMKQIALLLLLSFSWNVFARTAEDNLTLEVSRARKTQVRSISYHLYFELLKGQDNFTGKTIISLDLNHLNSDLSIDSLVKKINVLKVNGKVLSKFSSRWGSFDIPKASLSKKMTVEIEYTAEYSKEIRGFKRIIDPADNEEYSYSDLEPYYAHWIFPCMDQPDLKAKFTITVKSPEKWKVIHNEMIENEKVDGENKITSFKTTPPISTYLFFIAAGPYQEFNDQYGNIPLFIHTRKSKANAVDKEKIFDTAKKGLKFFTEYFDYPYPYSKYAQLFVPDLMTNAQENPGAVIIHEQYLYQGFVPVTWIFNRDIIMLHELAHMWFGNLVTMEWWSDLWLKESFASYASILAIERELKSDFASLDFLNSKDWGLWQDQLSTSHPIESEVPDTRTSKSIFDGITYAKGASVIKQLHFLVGEKGFKDGINAYFKKYALKNANRQEFIDSISKSSGINLDKWSEKWIQTAGPNRVKVKFECERDGISSASILQEKSSSHHLSPHRVKLGLYKLGTGEFKLITTKDVFYENAETIIGDLNGVACPDFVLPNQDDEDYALFDLDENSMRHAAKAMIQLPDALSRMQLWFMLMQKVRDQKLSAKSFMQMAMEAFKFEKDESLIGHLTSRYVTHRNLRLIYFYYLTIAERAALAPDLEKILWQRMVTSRPGTSAKVLFFEYYLTISQTKNAQDRIYEMVTKEKAPEGIPLDHIRRWRLIRSLAAKGHPQAKTLIESEGKKSPSTFNTCMINAATASLPDLKTKKKIFKNFLVKGTYTQCDYMETTYAFNNANYPELTKAFINEFFEFITTLDWKHSDNLAGPLFSNVFPLMLCNEEVEKISADKLKKAVNLTSISRKAWEESHDELSRCVKVRATR